MNYYFFLCFFLCSITTFSQQDSLDYYLNDNGLSDFNNILKLDVTQALKGDILFNWEHDFTGEFRMEAGVGLLTSHFARPWLDPLYRENPDPFDNEQTYVPMNPGFSIYLLPKWIDLRFPSYYIGFENLFQYYSRQLIVAETTFLFGKSFNLSPKLLLDIQAGIGMDNHWSLDNYYYMHKIMILKGKSGEKQHTINLIIPIRVKLGYRIDR
jgi:hypothetical protein